MCACSFEVVKIIHEKLLDQIGGGNKVPLVLVGNKTDLHLQRCVIYTASVVSIVTGITGLYPLRLGRS